MELGLEGKVALITGGSKGIGLAINKTLQEEGVEVISWSRSEGYDILNKFTPRIPNVDILINNVGGGGTWKHEEDQMEINYLTMVKLIKEFLEQDKKWGRIITIASIYGKEKGPNAGFVATKAAQIGYMKSLAGKYRDITFNTICPGCIDTKSSIKNYAKEKNMTLGQPQDVADITMFLCSDKASHINGACITVDGGDSHAF